MKLSQATTQQLYQIALNENNRLRIRYAAVRELQKRKVKPDDRKM